MKLSIQFNEDEQALAHFVISANDVQSAIHESIIQLQCAIDSCETMFECQKTIANVLFELQKVDYI
jgi:hypothetical protein